VDVARLKSEFLALYYDQHGTPLSARVFGNIHQVNKLAGLFPRLSNAMLTNPLAQWSLERLGIPTQRPLPKYAAQRFSQIPALADHYEKPDAVLVIDTFTEFNHPQIGEAVIALANHLRLKLNVLRLPGQGCCGRPAISKGLLDTAKQMANENVRVLAQQYGDAPYLFLEPSCQSSFTDDYLTLVDKSLQTAAAQVAARCMSVEQFFAEQPLDLMEFTKPILLHGHCHQKALWGTASTLRLLKRIPNVQVSEIASGCCGMAGSFGYEHYDISMKIARDRLLPAIEANPNALIVAPGTSCRSQIEDAGHSVKHPIEVIAMVTLWRGVERKRDSEALFDPTDDF